MECVYLCTVCGKKDPATKNQYLQNGVTVLYEIFSGY